MSTRLRILIVAGALAALATWPLLASHRAALSATSAAAPVAKDYLLRDKFIAFYEKQVRANPKDQITARTLADQYMQRFREQGDISDVERAENEAKRSIALQPGGNIQANMEMASALLTYHRFHQALKYEHAADEAQPGDNSRAQIASLEMEIADYSGARAILAHTLSPLPNPTWMSIQARYAELTGNVAEARALIRRSSRMVDEGLTIPAYVKSWYHFRRAQLAFETGDTEAARKQFDRSLEIYPDNSMTLMFQARFFRSLHEWHRAYLAATRSSDLYPLPQALGYKADAQRALGDSLGAQKTDALIDAERQLFNVQGINDRLLANYYAQRHVHLDYALAAAKRDLAQRGNEVYADDTMSWVLAAMGHWQQARPYSELAIRLHTADPVMLYHAGIIALHTGHGDQGRQELRLALSINPHFHPVYADDARRLIAAH